MSKDLFANNWRKALAIVRYLLAAFGIFLASKLLATLAGLGLVDVGLPDNASTWLWGGVLVAYLSFSGYAVYSLLKGERSLVGVLSTAGFVVLMASATLFFAKDASDCAANDAFMLCMAAGFSGLVICLATAFGIFACIQRRTIKKGMKGSE